MSGKWEESRCQVKRIGVVERIEADVAVLRVEGKAVRVPRDKIESRAAEGDLLGWSGKYWVRANDRT